MTSADVVLLVVAAGLVLLAGLLTSVEAAISSMSKARATELAAEGRPGATRLVTIVSDPARFVNTALLAAVACETTAIVIVTKLVIDLLSPTSAADPDRRRADGRGVVHRGRRRTAHGRPAALGAGRPRSPPARSPR